MEWSVVEGAVSWFWEELRDVNKIALLTALAAVISAIASWKSSRAAHASAEGAKDQWREMRSSNLKIVGGGHPIHVFGRGRILEPHAEYSYELKVRNIGMASAFDVRCAIKLRGHETYWNAPVSEAVSPDETQVLRIYFPRVEELHLPNHIRATVVFRDFEDHRMEVSSFVYVPPLDNPNHVPRAVILGATLDGQVHPDSPSQAEMDELQKHEGLEAILPIPDDVRVDTRQHNRFNRWRRVAP